MTNERYKKLSAEAKLLYALMDDRTCLSAANGWHDENGEVFIHFTIDEVCHVLHCRSEKACHVISELEEVSLIYRRKRGRGRAAMIYVSAPQDF